MNPTQLENRRIMKSLEVVSMEPMIWKPALLKVLGDITRRRLDNWIADGRFPQPDGVKNGHPWWFVSTIDTWRKSP